MPGSTLKLFVKGNADIVDAALSTRDGGGKLARGVRELVSSAHPGYEIEPSHEPSNGFAALRAELESGNCALIHSAPDIVLLSVEHDVRHLSCMGDDAAEEVRAVQANLVAVTELIKAKVGAHVLVANASTLDPVEMIFNYHDTDVPPISLSSHRMDLMLVGVSHQEGVSIIDVDRKIAEIGGAIGVVAALEYSHAGCEVLAGEIVRVIEDYGFFDDRPLLAQIGARAGGA